MKHRRCKDLHTAGRFGKLRTSTPLFLSFRFQSNLGEGLPNTRISPKAYNHPLAPSNPAQRNIVFPQSMHHKLGKELSQSAEELKNKAQRALLLQLQQDVLWEGTIIDNVDHRLIKHFVELSKNPKYRHSKNLAVVGGKELIRELCEKGFTPKHLLLTEGNELPEWARSSPGTEIVTVSRYVSDACSPGNDGFVGEFEIPPPPPKEKLIANKMFMNRVLVLDNIDDPGALGTVLRTAVGFQYDAIIVSNHCADLYDNRVIRAARGAHFQTAVPIYSLRDEDGDNTYGMLNHIVERNNLSPVCIAAQDDEDTLAADGKLNLVAGVKWNPKLPPKKAPKRNLEAFCLDEWSHEGRKGYMLVAGPNHKRKLVRKLTAKMHRPVVQLEVDSLPSGCDLLITLPVVMHALRPHAEWDYLPLKERVTSGSSHDLQTKFASVDIGANRLSVSEKDLNMDDDEQVYAANLKNEYMKWKRLRKNQLTDYDMWLNAEEKRVNAMLRRARLRMTEPWNTENAEKSQNIDSSMPEWVPNIIDEYRQNLDRDSLAREREVSETYVRPPNYESNRQRR